MFDLQVAPARGGGCAEGEERGEKSSKIQLRGATREVAGSPRKPSKNLACGQGGQPSVPFSGTEGDRRGQG